MLDIACDECGKKYRVDETKMRGARAKVKCKACSNIMVLTNPQAAASAGPSRTDVNTQPPITADIPEPPPPRSESVPQSVVDRPGGPVKNKPAEPVKDVSAFLSGQKTHIFFQNFAQNHRSSFATQSHNYPQSHI